MSRSTGILLVTCPDQKGLVAAIANFLVGLSANILHADQHEDSSSRLFLMRVEWSLDGTPGLEIFRKKFAPIAEKFSMTWRIEASADPVPAVLFVSKMDHCLADLLHRHSHGELPSVIKGVVSNHPDTERLVRFYGVPFHLVPVAPDSKVASENKQLEILAHAGARLAVLARYMQVLSTNFLEQFGHPVINVHHSFLPAFSGAKPYHRAFERGVKLIGATSHYVNEDLDDGPIIEQDVMRVSHRDQLDELIHRGREMEKGVLSRAVLWHASHRILVYERKTVIFD